MSIEQFTLVNESFIKTKLNFIQTVMATQTRHWTLHTVGQPQSNTETYDDDNDDVIYCWTGTSFIKWKRVYDYKNQIILCS